MKKIELVQGSPEWIAFRKDHIGASDVPAIMGVSPWSTPYKVWAEKMGLLEVFKNAAMNKGITYEGEARHSFEMLKGKMFPPCVLTNDEYPFLVASLDGMSEDGEIVEIKIPNAATHEKARQGIIEPHYNLQMQTQMLLAGTNECYYFSYDVESAEGVTILVERNDAVISEILDATTKFYEKYMIGFNSPEYDERDYEDVSDDKELAAILDEYKYLSNQAKFYNQLADLKKSQLIQRCGEKNVKGDGWKMTKITSKGRIDYAKLPYLKGIDLEPFRGKSTTSYRITTQGEV